MLTWREHKLDFLKPAKTSRGVYSEKKVLLIFLEHNGKTGVGEASPLPDLSIDGTKDLIPKLEALREDFLNAAPISEILDSCSDFPSLQFSLECANIQCNSKTGALFDTDYSKGIQGICINGLIWMNEISIMEEEALRKIRSGFHCIKFKVGSLEHSKECRMLERIRKQYSADKVEIRLDANGAFHFDDSLNLLKDFSKFKIHSIEQPIAAGNWDAMAEVCGKSSVKIALDEELIGVSPVEIGTQMLRKINPDFLILKPTLLGGFGICDRWISLAQKHRCGWWATSALDSNVGLGHIAQWVSSKDNQLAQGLGTGELYQHNFKPSAMMKGEYLWYQQNEIEDFQLPVQES